MMEGLFRQCWHKDPESEPRMEFRLYRVICLIASFFSFCVVIPTNFLQNISPYVSLIVFAFGVSTYLLYRATLNGHYHMKPLFALLMVAISGTWFLNGGSQGSISFYFFAMFIYPLVLFRGKTRWIMLGIAMLDVLLLLGAEDLFPQLVIPHHSQQDRFAALVMGIVSSGLSCAAMLWVVLFHYDREHQRLRQTNEELERTLAEKTKTEAELQEATEHVQALNEELDRRVADRTAQLELAISEQESFSYTVSHDLRMPLRHINSYATILREECGTEISDQARDCLDHICLATRNMGKLIDDLLELSRVNRSELKMEPVDLTNVAHLSSLMLRQTDSARSADFYIAPELTARGDKTLLTLVIDNLFSNAWKYTARREKARIEFGKESVGGKEVFYVRDNGIGFDMIYKDKVFSAFQRLHGVEYEGTGIGLATVKRIIERHEGNVWAEAKPDGGATFFFTLS